MTIERGPAGPWRILRELYTHRYLLAVFVRSDLRHRYTGSSIGVYWSVINQLFLLAIYTFVFSTILKVEYHGDSGVKNYALYLFCGMVPWFMVQEAVLRCTVSVIQKPELVQMPGFPPAALPAHIVLSGMAQNLVSLGLLLIAVVVFAERFCTSLLAMPLVLLFQLLLTLGLGFLAASLNVFYRDTQHIVSHMMLIWMFVTPIFYPSAIFPKDFEVLLVLNPMAHLVDNYRELIMKDNVPWKSLWTLAGSSLIVFAIGLYVFQRAESDFADTV